MTINFKPDDVWSYRGRDVRFERYLGDDLVQFTDQRTLTPFLVEGGEGALMPPTMTWMLEAYAAGDFIRIPSMREGAVRKLAEKREYDSEEVRKKDKFAILRRFVVREMDRKGVGPVGDRAMAIELSKIWASAPVEVLALGVRAKPRTVRRWLRERGAVGERPLKQMISLSGRVQRRRRLPGPVHRLLNEFALLFWSDRSLSLADAYARFAVDLELVSKEREARGELAFARPSHETFRKLVRRLECFETYKARYGEKLATLRFEGGGEGLRASRFLELGCLDHKHLDNLVIIDAERQLPLGKPWLTAIIDVFTACIVGFVVSFEPPSLYAATECVKRANMPKLHLLRQGAQYAKLCNIYGRFDEIVVDNGLEFAGIAFEDAMADAGISVRWAPVRSPTFKSPIERFFRTVDDRLLHKLPGSTLSPKALEDLEIDPVAEATLSLAELESLLWDAINFYHLDLHTGKNAIPAQLWDDDIAKFGIDVIADVRQLDKMAGAVERGRNLTRAGIEFLGLAFHDKAVTSGLLNDLAGIAPQRGHGRGARSHTVKIKYNPADLREIHVWNDRRRRYISLPCTEPEYAAGLSIKQHEIIREFAAKRNEAFSSMADRLRMRAELSKRIEELTHGKAAKNRATIARLYQSPSVQEAMPHGVALAFAPERADGLAPVLVENDTLAMHRNDGGKLSKRPPRAGAVKGKKTKDKVDELQEAGAPPTFGDFAINTFKGFGQ